MLHQGRLKNWDPATGTGLIQRDKAGPALAINYDSFRKKPEQLQDGDCIFFQIEIDAQDQAKAVLAYKAGQQLSSASSDKKPVASSWPVPLLLSGMLSLSLLVWLGYHSWL